MAAAQPFRDWGGGDGEAGAVIQFEVDTKDVDRMLRWTATLQGQLPYATSRALNDTAKQMAEDLNASTANPRYFDKPTPFTQKGYRVSQFSSKTNPVAELDLKPIQRSYLLPSIQGGIRPQRPSELKLSARFGGLKAWAPGLDARRNQYGNITKAAAVAALRGNGSTFLLQQQRGQLAPGVYQRVGKGKVKNLLGFGELPSISRRWPVQQLGQQSIARHWPGNFERWLKEATK